MKKSIVILVVIGLLLVVGVVIKQNSDDISDLYRPAFSIPDLNNVPHKMSEWDGKVVLINFWASWCPPCIKEIPDLVKLKKIFEKQEFEIIGIAVDSTENINKFLINNPVNYTVLVGEQVSFSLMKKLSNTTGSLPFSVLIDRSGNIKFKHLGVISIDQIKHEVSGLL